MRTLDLLFWAVCAAVTLFVAWQFLTLILETVRTEWSVRRPPKGARHAASGGLGGDSMSTTISGATSDSTDSGGSDSSGDSSGGGDFSSGGGDYGGGGSSGSWS